MFHVKIQPIYLEDLTKHIRGQLVFNLPWREIIYNSQASTMICCPRLAARTSDKSGYKETNMWESKVGSGIKRKLQQTS
ncbi:hypothetical protein HN011_005802 [Eciton burchellii]|nr:hypothetical protein HN011_005802 [Eciton burchellii]